LSVFIKVRLAKLVCSCSDFLFVFKFIANSSGKEYKVGFFKKLKLAKKIKRNNKKIKSLTVWDQHFVMVEEILRIPKSLKGDVVECGCFNGASTVNLSLACALTGRRLLVCDSFEGLPQPEDQEKHDIHAHSTDYYIWEQGEFSSDSGLEGVKKNVAKYGNINVCHFVKGYFNETLKNLDTDNVVFVFEDADIASSVADCLRYLWPKLKDGCKFYCHEPWSIQVVSLFYNKQWWKDNLDTQPPGFYGSGFGLKVGVKYTKIGYAQKFDPQKIKEDGKKIILSGSKGENK
jgi:O-methyltransferase